MAYQIRPLNSHNNTLHWIGCIINFKSFTTLKGGHWGVLNTALPQKNLQIPQYRKKIAKYCNIAMRSIP